VREISCRLSLEHVARRVRQAPCFVVHGFVHGPCREED
jgi:hypothetical protein